MNTKALLLIAVLVVVVVVIALNTPQVMELLNPGWTGGPCSYHTYVGKCQVVSILPTYEPNGSYLQRIGYQGFDVNYTFIPANPSELSSWLKYDWQKHVLSNNLQVVLEDNDTIYGYYPPGPLYLKKYNLVVNSSFDCNISLITEGSCNPFGGFQFNYPNGSDSFEVKAVLNASNSSNGS